MNYSSESSYISGSLAKCIQYFEDRICQKKFLSQFCQNSLHHCLLLKLNYGCRVGVMEEGMIADQILGLFPFSHLLKPNVQTLKFIHVPQFYTAIGSQEIRACCF